MSASGARATATSLASWRRPSHELRVRCFVPGAHRRLRRHAAASRTRWPLGRGHSLAPSHRRVENVDLPRSATSSTPRSGSARSAPCCGDRASRWPLVVRLPPRLERLAGAARRASSARCSTARSQRRGGALVGAISTPAPTTSRARWRSARPLAQVFWSPGFAHHRSVPDAGEALRAAVFELLQARDFVVDGQRSGPAPISTISRNPYILDRSQKLVGRALTRLLVRLLRPGTAASPRASTGSPAAPSLRGASVTHPRAAADDARSPITRRDRRRRGLVTRHAPAETS